MLHFSIQIEAKNETERMIMEKGLTTGKRYLQIFYKRHKKPWFANGKFKRQFIVTINICRTGNFKLAASLFRRNIITNPNVSVKNQMDLNITLFGNEKYEIQRQEHLISLKN